MFRIRPITCRVRGVRQVDVNGYIVSVSHSSHHQRERERGGEGGCYLKSAGFVLVWASSITRCSLTVPLCCVLLLIAYRLLLDCPLYEQMAKPAKTVWTERVLSRGCLMLSEAEKSPASLRFLGLFWSVTLAPRINQARKKQVDQVCPINHSDWCRAFCLCLFIKNRAG